MRKRQSEVNDINESPRQKNVTYTYPKYKNLSFQGKSSRSCHCFKLDIDWVIENFKTMEPEFYNCLFLEHVPGQDDKEQTIFYVSIGNAKDTDDMEYLFCALNITFQQR